MKQHVVIVATVGALALPGFVEAADDKALSRGVNEAPASAEREWVDPTELTELLARKGLITPEEQRDLARDPSEPAVDQAIFRTESYQSE
jgi:hypothetical protein